MNENNSIEVLENIKIPKKETIIYVIEEKIITTIEEQNKQNEKTT